MKSSIKLIIIIVFTMLQHYSEAQNNDSLANYLTIAGENNTGLKAGFLKYSASLEKTNQVGSLPDPQLEIGFFLKPMEIFSGEQVADIKLMQMFPWFGTLAASKEEASQMAKAYYENFISYRNELFYNVKSEYYQLFKTKKEIDITRENIKILKTIEKLAIVKYQAGTGSGSTNSASPTSSSSGNQTTGANSMGGMNMASNSVNTGAANSSMPPMPSSMSSQPSGGMVSLFRIQIEINDLENNLSLLEDKLKSRKASFNRYLSRPQETEVFISDSLQDEILQEINHTLVDSVVNNPMVKMYLADSAAYSAKMKMIRKMSNPMFGIGLSYTLINKSEMSTSMMNGKDMIMPMLSVSLPIYRKKYSSAIKEAEFLRDAASNLTSSTIQDFRVSFQQLLLDLHDAERRCTLFTTQTKLAEQSLNLIIASFSANESDFEEILRMEQQLLEFKLSKLTAITDKNTAVAKIILLTGK